MTPGGSAATVKKFYVADSLTIAVRTVTGGQDTLNWILSDHLSSASATANTVMFHSMSLREGRPVAVFVPGDGRFCFNPSIGMVVFQTALAILYYFPLAYQYYSFFEHYFPLSTTFSAHFTIALPLFIS